LCGPSRPDIGLKYIYCRLGFRSALLPQTRSQPMAPSSLWSPFSCTGAALHSLPIASLSLSKTDDCLLPSLSGARWRGSTVLGGAQRAVAWLCRVGRCAASGGEAPRGQTASGARWHGSTGSDGKRCAVARVHGAGLRCVVGRGGMVSQGVATHGWATEVGRSLLPSPSLSLSSSPSLVALSSLQICSLQVLLQRGRVQIRPRRVGPDPVMTGRDPATAGPDPASARPDPATTESLELDCSAWTRRRRARLGSTVGSIGLARAFFYFFK
jgi:hypothetical protein